MEYRVRFLIDAGENVAAGEGRATSEDLAAAYTAYTASTGEVLVMAAEDQAEAMVMAQVLRELGLPPGTRYACQVLAVVTPWGSAEAEHAYMAALVTPEGREVPNVSGGCGDASNVRGTHDGYL